MRPSGSGLLRLPQVFPAISFTAGIAVHQRLEGSQQPHEQGRPLLAVGFQSLTLSPDKVNGRRAPETKLRPVAGVWWLRVGTPANWLRQYSN